MTIGTTAFPSRQSLQALQPYSSSTREAACRLNLNESPFEWDEAFRRELLRRFETRTFRRYPDVAASRLRKRLAGHYELEEKNIIVGNGSNELLMIAFQTYVQTGRRVILLEPSFGLYETVAKLSDAEIVRVPCDPASAWLPSEELRRVGSDSIVVIGSPNNPTGAALREGELQRILDAGAFVFLDRAYGDFARDTFPPLHERLITFSSFSKAWGLAACRVGWLATTEENCRELAKVRLPYNLNAFSEEAALLALEQSTRVTERVDRTIAERERVAAALASIDGVTPFPSSANFIAFTTADPRALWEAVADRGVLLREPFRISEMEQAIRVTIGTREENDRFIRALKIVLGGEENEGPDEASPAEPALSGRQSKVVRQTAETAVAVEVNLDGSSNDTVIQTPVGFLSHMLHVISRHGAMALDVSVTGDTEVDYHHTVEDTALVLGEAVRNALGSKKGIRRFGSAYVPLDESLARVVIDFSGRPFLSFEVPIDREMLLIHKDFPFALVEEFFKSFANACACNVHVDLLRGRNGHHAAEAIFKAFAIALRAGKEVVGGDVPSTKGVLA